MKRERELEIFASEITLGLKKILIEAVLKEAAVKDDLREIEKGVKSLSLPYFLRPFFMFFIIFKMLLAASLGSKTPALFSLQTLCIE